MLKAGSNAAATRLALLWLALLAPTSFSWSTHSMFVGHLSRTSAARAIARQLPHYPTHSIPSSTSTTTRMFARKAGVAEPEELRAFVEKAGTKLLVVDVRNPDAEKEPGDQKSLAVAPLPSTGVRPQAVHLIWDRDTDSMPLPPTSDLETPIITHCGGGGRGQLAMDFLMAKGFKNVLNGGGPKETDCWAEFGNK
jgi:rhodanese-related sulfurtransferase